MFSWENLAETRVDAQTRLETLTLKITSAVSS